LDASNSPCLVSSEGKLNTKLSEKGVFILEIKCKRTNWSHWTKFWEIITVRKWTLLSPVLFSLGMAN